MFAERQYWQDVADRFVKENVTVKPNRGNIISSDGKLMASSLPEYRIYMDFMSGEKDEKRRQKDQARRDSILNANMDSICIGLHKIFPDKSAAQFKAHLKKGRQAKSRNYLIYPKRISYIQYKEVKRLPVFCLNRYKGGFKEQAYNQRKKPFGSLAARTLGDVYADTAKGARNGIELAFDTILKGRDGLTHRQKVMNKYLNIVDVPPVDGCDLISTIDVGMQDICEKALVDKLKELNASVGVVVLMEVSTGEVKAIVNMMQGKDGEYYEMRNNAISDMLEPGSTFKTASIMVALEDGKITPDYVVDTGNGQMPMYGRVMKDHNWHRGGYGKLTVTEILGVSSNVGTSYIIDHFYGSNPQKFVDGLKRMSIDQPLHLQIAGEGKPNIRGPKERYFAKTTLPWMSIGYETQVPPINILTFYNGIANNGVTVRPKFVKAAMKDGEVVKEYPTEVINPKICSDKTLAQIREILRKVVGEGLAKPAGSKQFHVSGKTGTAQISQGAAGYKTGRTNYLVSFCGYFPSEAPKYSMIVSIQKPGLPASGGLMAGSVFSKIAERVYAKDLRLPLTNAIDTNSVVIPNVKAGEMREAQRVLEELQINVQGKIADSGKEDYVVDTGNGQMPMYGRVMKDHNWHRGGYGKLTVTEILGVSSNVGTSYIIDHFYGSNPQKFVDGLKRMSIDQPLHLQIAGEGKPNIRGPKERYFAKTTLPWMSIGYETQVPPINILTFYNGIANNGVTVRPKFVKAAMKDGEVVKEYPTEVINPKICSDKTLAQIREILRKVVGEGLAKPAGSKQFHVSGKTGTAQISQGAAGYKTGRTNYLVSFCGYFPSEAPKYSMIVSIQKPGLPASGGLMAGSVFSKIAERVYAKDLRLPLTNAIDTNSVVIPNVKAGEMREAQRVLEELQINVQGKIADSGKEVWGNTHSAPQAVVLESRSNMQNFVPSVIGMGAKDAVYLLESKGLKVNLVGVGKVKSQSIANGTIVKKGQTVTLTLN